MSRNCTVKNQTRRQVTFRGRSGRFRHLPPMSSIEVPEVEVADNAFVEKLVKRRILAVADGGKSQAAKAASAPQDDKAGKSAKKPRASLSAMVKTKEASKQAKDGDDASGQAEPPIETGDTEAAPDTGKKT